MLLEKKPHQLMSNCSSFIPNFEPSKKKSMKSTILLKVQPTWLQQQVTHLYQNGFYVNERRITSSFLGLKKQMTTLHRSKRLLVTWPWTWIFPSTSSIIFELEHQTVAVCTPWWLNLHAREKRRQCSWRQRSWREWNKPDRATMRPDCVSACID